LRRIVNSTYISLDGVNARPPPAPMRPLYKRRRDALVAALRTHAPDLVPSGVAAGLHLVARLPGGLPEREVVAAAARRGVACHGLEPYCLSPPRSGALLFGYATLDEDELELGARAVGEALAEVRDGR
jgi:GntR family transcriptional regulator/MocR family aminotransferase